MIKRLIPWVLFGLSLLGNLYLFALLLDAGALIDGAKSRVERLRERSDLALSVVRKDWIGKDAAYVIAISEEAERQGVSIKKTKEGSFEIGDLIFETKGGVVTEVRYFD